MNLISIKSFATPATALLFSVMGVSGVMLYFHLQESYVKEMHETLGLFFIGAVLLHVSLHSKSLKNYITKPLFGLLGGVVLASVVGFVLSVEPAGVSPKKVMLDAMLAAPLQKSSEVLGVDIEVVKERLRAKNIHIDGTKTLKSLSKESGVSAYDMVLIITDKK